MGCDIHIWTEAKIDGKWTFVPGRALEPHEGKTHLEMMVMCKMVGIPKWYETQDGWDSEEVPQDRDYDLFALLADVRNYSNVTALKEPDYIIPGDASPEVTGIFKDWGQDAHSAVTYTLSELDSHDWNSLLRYKCTLAEDTIPRLKKLAAEFKLHYDDVRLIMWFYN